MSRDDDDVTEDRFPIVAVFDDEEAAREAFDALVDKGFDPEEIDLDDNEISLDPGEEERAELAMRLLTEAGGTLDGDEFDEDLDDDEDDEDDEDEEDDEDDEDDDDLDDEDDDDDLDDEDDDDDLDDDDDDDDDDNDDLDEDEDPDAGDERAR